MLEIIERNKFMKDLNLAKKRGKEITKLLEMVEKLAKQEKLPEKNKQHRLTGNWNLFSECHIEPDWLLIYRIKENILILERTGTHSDLF